MTVIGKILTFIIFFMSLVFLGMAITINQLNKDPKTKQSWVDVAKHFREVEIPKLQRDVAVKDSLIIERDAEILKLKNEIAQIRQDWEREVRQARDQAAADRAEAQKAKADFEKSQVAVQNLEIELAKRREEAIALQEVIKQKELTNANIQADLVKATNEKIAAQVAAQTYADRVRTLEKQNQELVRALEEANQQNLERPTAKTEIVRRPPPDDVRGIIKAVGQDGLVSISIGSDAGLLRGHTLEVFRTEPKPQYLGVVQIIEVSPHESVGKLLTPQFKKAVQPNDQVASKILPSRP
ncbi:MAG: hypothetical protein NZM31_13405 [Gemmatales bacterium]|nr:hypothetical protein [Gemmatales bacterium]MDW8387994.1 hypothetical protein [Gemmatales bacterium]